MSAHAELSQFTVAVLAALIPVIPIAVGLLITYLKVLENRVQIDQKPSSDTVVQAIDSKIAEYHQGGGPANDATGSTSGGGAIPPPAGNP